MTKIYQSLTELIGQTPIVRLNHLPTSEMAQVFVKLESFNPGGSVKDRIAYAMIEAAEQSGALKPSMTIIEPTSGNTGIGLAWIGKAKGYQVVLVMPETMSMERRQLMQAYGAELLLTPGSEGMKGAIAAATKLAAQDDYFMPMQFENEANPAIHEQTTGPEIGTAFKELGLDAVVAGVGTGGTISGITHYLKNDFPALLSVAVEPADSAILTGGAAGPHKIQGIGAGFIPATLDTASYDQVIDVTNEQALTMARNVAAQEGILIGISGGAAVHAALEIAQKLGPDKNVLAVIPDSGERYLSTGLYATPE